MEQKMLRLLESCRSLGQLKQTHVQIFIHGLEQNNFLLPKLITLTSSFASINDAVAIFQSSHSPNVFVYNTMIQCFIAKNHRKHAFHTYNSMIKASSSVSPNNFTFTFLIKSCKSFAHIQDGAQIQTHVIKFGFGTNVFIQNTLLNLYSKCGENLVLARKVFDEMSNIDVVSWNSMISAYMNHGETSLAIQLFYSMPEKNLVSWNSIVCGLCRSGDMESAKSVFVQMPIRNDVSWNFMISGYVRRGYVRSAHTFFSSMPGKTPVSWTAMISGYTMIGDLKSATQLFCSMPVKNVISWNAMIAGYVRNNMFDRALSVFHQMLTDGGCRPDEATLVSVLSACAHLGSLEHGKWINSYIKRNNYGLAGSLGNALINMFAKCGDIENAVEVFHKMTKRCIVAWTTIISGLAFNGHSREALSIFDRMCEERIEPDDVIFISVLSACTHGGLVEEGKRVFDQMIHKFFIEPRVEHYGCMVDLLSRAGKVEEAFRFIMSMPIEPNAIIWATLLASCKSSGKRELAEVVTQKILDLDSSNSGYMMLMSNLNALSGRWADVLGVRAAMRKDGIDKVPGCSSIQIANMVHEFLVKDQAHEQRKEIYQILDILNLHLKAFSEGIEVVVSCT